MLLFLLREIKTQTIGSASWTATMAFENVRKDVHRVYGEFNENLPLASFLNGT